MKLPKIKFKLEGSEAKKTKEAVGSTYCKNCGIRVQLKGWTGPLAFLNKNKRGYEYEEGYYCTDCHLKMIRQNRNKPIERVKDGNSN